MTNQNRQSGQSLIETIAATFILTMALTAGLGVAIFSFSTSNISNNEITATNLAREGVEVVRMLRDSNWLAGDVSGDASYNLQPCSDINSKSCYPKAFDGPTGDFNAGSYPTFTAQSYRINFNAASGSWSLDTDTNNSDLYLQSNGTYTHTVNGIAVYNRQVKISFNTSGYTAQNPEVIVKSIVAWRGKNCAAITSGVNLESLATACKVTVEEHLTNWKDYK